MFIDGRISSSNEWNWIELGIEKRRMNEMIKKRCVFIGGAHLCRFHQRRSRSTWPVVRSFTCDSSASIFIFIFIFSLLLLWLSRAALLSLALAHFSLISIRRVFNGKTASMGQNGRKIDFVFNGHSALCFFFGTFKSIVVLWTTILNV